MPDFDAECLVDLINVVGSQDASAEIEITRANMSANFYELGVDSLTLLSVTAQLESQYGIKVGFEEAISTNSPEELLTLVNSMMNTELQTESA